MKKTLNKILKLNLAMYKRDNNILWPLGLIQEFKIDLILDTLMNVIFTSTDEREICISINAEKLFDNRI